MFSYILSSDMLTHATNGAGPSLSSLRLRDAKKVEFLSTRATLARATTSTTAMVRGQAPQRAPTRRPAVELVILIYP